MFVAVPDVVVERNVFSLLIELEVGRGRETLGEGGLAIKLVRKLPRGEHGLGMGTGRLRKAGIER